MGHCSTRSPIGAEPPGGLYRSHDRRQFGSHPAARSAEIPVVKSPTRTLKMLTLVHSFFSSCGGLRSCAWTLRASRCDERCAPDVEDAVSDGGIADLLVPARDWQLGSEDGGTSLVAIFADLPDFAALIFIQRRHRPVINDQNIDTAQSSQEVAQAPSARARASSRSKAAVRK